MMQCLASLVSEVQLRDTAASEILWNLDSIFRASRDIRKLSPVKCRQIVTQNLSN